MLIGYARVSTQDQNLEAQMEALRAAGCERIYQEKISGGARDRPELARAMEQLRAGDTLVVWKLDRLARSLSHLLAILQQVDGLGAGFRSLSEAVETNSAVGRMVIQMLGAIAEFERSLIRERTMEGLKAARRSGRGGGRPHALTLEQRQEVALQVLEQGKSQAHVARLFEVGRATVQRAVQEYQHIQEIGQLNDSSPVPQATSHRAAS